LSAQDDRLSFRLRLRMTTQNALLSLVPFKMKIEPRILEAIDCEVRTDNLTRQLYATDASHYRIEPVAVAFPRNPAQARAAMLAAREADIPLIPRGAGSGLAGGAVGDGLVMDFSRHMRNISELNLEEATLRVEPGVVLDQLNAYLKPHGRRFGPDVATSSRATLGGMIANNSSGAPYFGLTCDHVLELDILLADGTQHSVSSTSAALPDIQRRLAAAVGNQSSEIRERMPAGLLKRWPGYALDRYLRDTRNLAHLIGGSEGTLALILSAKLRIVPIPREQGIGLAFFSSVLEAMQATVDLLDLQPAGIEHIDRVLFDQTRGQSAFRAARELMRLDEEPCEAILIVEFFDQVEEKLKIFESRNYGLRSMTLRDATQSNRVWHLRKAGLSLLTGCKGAAKPVTCIEDSAVRPAQLADFYRDLQQLLESLRLKASFYGHAAAGLLHVRPVLNLKSADDLVRFRRVADEFSALVRKYQGSIAAEHGLGRARAEYLQDHVGKELVELMREVKTAFDPEGRLNPGKVLFDGRHRLDNDLRTPAGYSLELPFQPRLAFAAKDESFLANLDQCNGCGGCRKETPTMCPTFLATGEELMSTRGRANLIRATLEGRASSNSHPLLAPELQSALSNCLSCKACTTECPSNVNMALLKAELTHARQQRHGATLPEWVFSRADILGQIGCFFAPLSNAVLKVPLLRRLTARMLGMTSERELPGYARERFDRWFAKRRNGSGGSRGKVILWDDTFVRYHEPHIGHAAVRVLEAAGFSVALAHGRKCCGRPAFSQGRLDVVEKLGRHNLDLLQGSPGQEPILFLEPSCYSMFVEDYRELKLAGASAVAARCFLFEDFMLGTLEKQPDALQFHHPASAAAIHAHCHVKALASPARLLKLADYLPDCRTTLMETGCCGMAGAFGYKRDKYELSLQVGRLLADAISRLEPGTTVVASGTSCRQQISHLTAARPLHMAELLAQAL
jgi:FAD/FMN-containing dehydrogenase/Fe-S oxidoreductase